MHSYPKFFFILFLTVCLAGCGAIQTVAPPVNTQMVAVAKGNSLDTLTAGRRLLTMRCTNCHALEPIAKYTPTEWKKNVHRMADRAGLNETEIHDITSYLVAARETLPPTH